MANERRLIDANVVLARLKTDIVLGECEKAFLRNFVNNAPTVDAVEVVHGRWVDEYPYVRCSECNAEWINCKTDNEPMLFYYCPNCGATMDGDGNA